MGLIRVFSVSTWLSFPVLAASEKLTFVRLASDCAMLFMRSVTQECKSLNGRLVNFLRERKTVEALLRYLVQNPDQAGDAASSDADSKQRFKYPYAACEVRFWDV